MSYLTVQSLEKTCSLNSTSAQKARKKSLVARWLLVDGKLVCKWLSIDS